MVSLIPDNEFMQSSFLDFFFKKNELDISNAVCYYISDMYR